MALSAAIDRSRVDPSVTDEEIERAIDGTPAPFTMPGVQDDLDDVLYVGTVAAQFAAAPIVAASVKLRIAHARRLREEETWCGVGMCLATVRGPILGLPPVYPTAEAAGEHSSPFHPKKTHTAAAPRGSIGFAFNDGDGHVWLELGAVTVDGKPDALVSTTDFHVPGYEGVALRSRMLPWCRAKSWGIGWSVNGYPVWPDSKKPGKPWTWQDTEAQLKRDLARAKKNHADQRKIDGLQHWITRMEAHHAK